MSNEETLRNRLRDSEDRFTERKSKGASSEKIRETLIAFANSLQDGEEAILFIGVSDKGSFLGVDNVDKRQREIRSDAQTKCYPPIQIQCEVLKESGIEVLAVTVPFSRNKPHFGGPAYVRVGSENVRATQEILENLITSRNDPARMILSYRDQDSLVMLDLLPDHSRVQCKVLDCNSQYARFRDERGGIRSISLGSIRISWEGQMNMPLIVEHHR